jgi:hypothetical protein
MVGLGSRNNVVMSLCAAAEICTSFIHASVYRELQRKAPELANAS